MAGVVITMSGDEARLFNAIKKVVEQQDKLNNKLKEGSKASEVATERASSGFGKAAQAVNSYSTSVSVATVGLGMLTQITAQLNTEQEKAIVSATKLEAANRRNLQLASTSADFAKSNAESDALAVKFGVSREQARDIFFQSESGGFQDSREFITRASGVVDPTTAATIATKFPSMFSGVSPDEAIKLTGFSAKNSPLNFEQMAAVAPTVAQGMSLLNATMEESLGAQSVLAKRFKGNGEQVADSLKSFTTSLGIDERFKGKGFIAGFQALQALPEAERKKFLGSSQELNVAYTVISQEFASIVQATQANVEEMKRIRSGGGMLMDQITISEKDPLIAGMKESIRAQVIAEIANEEKSAVSGFRAKAASSYADAQMIGNANLLQRTVDTGLKDFVSELPFVGGLLGGIIPDSNSQFVARNLANMGVSPETAGQFGAGLSMATTDPGGFLGLLQTMVTSQIKSSEVMADAAKEMAESVERSSINSKANGARGMAGAASQ